MLSFIEQFKAARKCGVPLIAIETNDEAATMKTLLNECGNGHDAVKPCAVEYRLGQTNRWFHLKLFDLLDRRQGIEHVVAAEQGFVLPGMVVAAGDSALAAKPVA